MTSYTSAGGRESVRWRFAGFSRGERPRKGARTIAVDECNLLAASNLRREQQDSKSISSVISGSIYIIFITSSQKLKRFGILVYMKSVQI